jgi:hypothetical protein
MRRIRRDRNVIAARLAQPRGVVLALTILAFLLQGLVTQAHIHGEYLTAPSTGLTHVASADAASTKQKPTAPDDEKHCPFCQEIMSAGAYVAPAPTLLLLPQQTFFAVTTELVVPAYVNAASHFWRGRAPPSA